MANTGMTASNPLASHNWEGQSRLSGKKAKGDTKKPANGHVDFASMSSLNMMKNKR